MENQSFEQVYGRYPFANLVDLGIALGKTIARHRRQGPSQDPRAIPGAA